MRRRVTAGAVLLGMMLSALAFAPGLAASSIGGGGISNQLGARLERPEAAPAVKAGVTYDAVVVSADKLAAFGLTGYQSGDRIRITVLSGNRISVSFLSPGTGQDASKSGAGGPRKPTRVTSATLNYNNAGKLAVPAAR